MVTWRRAFLALVVALASSLALPGVRNALIDMVLYQTVNLSPPQEASTVLRPVHMPWGIVKVRVPVQAGTVRVYTFTSPLLHRAPTRQMYIYLPPGYDSPLNARRRYPVVYLLHGAPGGPADWTKGAHANLIADEMIAAGQMRPMILAMPDGNGGQWRDTEYVNKFNGTDNEMDYLAYGVVPWVDAHFRTIPRADDRALGGMSMGGYGAYNVGLHHPELWRTLFSISGYFAADRSEVFGANDPLGHNPQFLVANSPTAYVARVPGVRSMNLLIEESTADWGGYTQKAQAFDRELTTLGIPHTLDMHHPTGLVLWDHSWAYWQLALRHALAYASAHSGR
jgi:enterochelin esterase-like enzyme